MNPEEKKTFYADLEERLRALAGDERDFVANAANASALLFHSLPEVNWAGFYVARGDELVLGPFQGKPACVRIALGRGVCGTAAVERRTIAVGDVREFPGHIACDAASRSEIVVPVIAGDRLFAVLDIDSPVVGRFDEADSAGLEGLVGAFAELTEF